jgi:ferrochelatase
MPAYSGQGDFTHSSPGTTGILLVNLGTPTAPTTAATRRFLAEFLSDPRVVELPRWLWRVILHGFILRFRPGRSAHAYGLIWTDAGSPLLVHSRNLADALRGELAARWGNVAKLALGMTYGTPSIASALDELREAGARRILVLPLYPQYSATTTASVFDKVTRVLQGWRWVPELRFVNQYHDAPGYIAAVAKTIEDHWQKFPRRHLVFSFHGVPKRYLDAGDPYFCQCHKTARLVSEKLELARDAWTVSFQSRFGREEWLQPYTDVTLLEHAQRGSKQIDVVCPGFATDCLETLEEIAIRNREIFLAAGGKELNYIPALNSTPAHVLALTDVIQRAAQGWPGVPASAEADVAIDYAASAARAKALGAQR